MSDGAVYMAFGQCLRCRRPFAFNPVAVPSVFVTDELSLLLGKKAGVREPLCRQCFDVLNAERVARGLTPWSLQPDAYTPLPEGEMP